MDPDYADLVARLDAWAVSASAPGDEGPIEVVLTDGRRVTVVLDAHGLDVLFVVHVDVPSVVGLVVHELERLPAATQYLVADREYRLVPSATLSLPERPPRPPRAPAASGGWFVYGEVRQGRVAQWHDDDGWGVLDSTATPDGCWAHVSTLSTGSLRLEVGQEVQFTAERAQQDGYDFRATEVWLAGRGPDRSLRTQVDGPSPAYRSRLRLNDD